MTTSDDTHPTLDALDARVHALESGSNSWAALVGEDVRRMHRELDQLREEVSALRAELAAAAGRV